MERPGLVVSHRVHLAGGHKWIGREEDEAGESPPDYKAVVSC